MKKRSGFLILLLVVLTAWIAWKATEPNPYHARGDESVVQPYQWQYVAWMFTLGILVLGLLSFRKPLWSFLGASIAYGLSAFLSVSLLAGGLHAPPVHDHLFSIVFSTSIGLLFYSGYTCAVWRIGAREAGGVD